VLLGGKKKKREEEKGGKGRRKEARSNIYFSMPARGKQRERKMKGGEGEKREKGGDAPQSRVVAFFPPLKKRISK